MRGASCLLGSPSRSRFVACWTGAPVRPRPSGPSEPPILWRKAIRMPPDPSPGHGEMRAACVHASRACSGFAARNPGDPRRVVPTEVRTALARIRLAACRRQLVGARGRLVGARVRCTACARTLRGMRTILLLGVLLVACGHAPTPPPAPPAAADPRASALPPLPPVGPNTMGWTTWSHEQKLAYMKQTVLPAEREIFGRFEPLRFARMTCETCHGQGARDGSFRMPDPDLPHIVGGRGGFQELIARQPETVRFMQQAVSAETARLLGHPVFDMEKHVGFSCYPCHVRDDVKDWRQCRSVSVKGSEWIRFSTAREVSAMDVSWSRSVLLGAASRCGCIAMGNQARERECGARARWPVDAAGPRTTTRTRRRNACVREVVALRPWTTAHQNARSIRCAVAHRAHRPYRHEERSGSLEEDPEHLRGCAHLLPKRDVGPTVPAGTFGNGTASTWAPSPPVAWAHELPAGTLGSSTAPTWAPGPGGAEPGGRQRHRAHVGAAAEPAVAPSRAVAWAHDLSPRSQAGRSVAAPRPRGRSRRARGGAEPGGRVDP